MYKLKLIYSLASEHVLRKIHHCTFRARKLEKINLPRKISEWAFLSHLHLNFYLFSRISATGQPFITAQTAFHHCTFQVITAHFVRHCTLKQAMHRL